jgi:protein AroM
MSKEKSYPSIGLITIGQSPREDITSDIKTLLGKQIRILESGALDNLSTSEIKNLYPEKNDFPLITRLKDKSSVIVGKEKIYPLILAKILEIEDLGVQFSALLCTEDFPEFESRRLVLLPSRLIFFSAISLLPDGRLCVVVPMEEQKAKMQNRWKRTGLKVKMETINPYGNLSGLEKICHRISRQKFNLIVLDCMGYSLKIKQKIKGLTGIPVLLPRSILTRYFTELI